MQNKEILFSVIIPIYKVEQYLCQCVESVLCQSFRNFEVILVDDGSPDKCPKICDEYEKKDSRVIVIHKQNGGLSSARNCGTKQAKGKYIIYLDSDDYWDDKNALKQLSECLISEPDICIFKSKDFSCITSLFTESYKDYDLSFMNEADSKRLIKYLLTEGLFPGAAWLVAVNRNYIYENKFSFIENIKAEDIDWLLNIFLNANRITALNNSFYIYRKYRPGSITKNSDLKSVKDLIYTIDIWVHKIEQEKYLDIKAELYEYLSWHYVCALLSYGKLPVVERKTIKSQLKKYDMLLNYSTKKKNKVIKLVYKLFGLDICAMILSKYRAWSLKT